MEKEKKKEDYSAEALAKRYNVNLDKLKKEQEKLAKQLEIKDTKDFSDAKIAGVFSVFSGNQVISAVVLCDENLEILEQAYYQEKASFPYISGFRAYRELPSLLAAIEKLDEKPDLILVNGHGIAHERLGLASHLSLSCGIPTIGIANKLLHGKVEAGKIKIGEKIVGGEVVSREKARPLYVSPGNMIDLKTAVELVQRIIKFPHKLPEPLHLAMRYAKKVRKELA